MCACIYKYNIRGPLPLGGFAPQTPTPSRPSASSYWFLQNWPLTPPELAVDLEITCLQGKTTPLRGCLQPSPLLLRGKKGLRGCLQPSPILLRKDRWKITKIRLKCKNGIIRFPTHSRDLDELLVGNGSYGRPTTFMFSQKR